MTESFGDEMKSAFARPILFSAPMVRAILDGRKTQTRRIIKHFDGKTYATDPDRVYWREPDDFPPELFVDQYKWWAYDVKSGSSALPVHGERCRYGRRGDALWVKETFRSDVEVSPPRRVFYYKADADVLLGRPYTREVFGPWTPSIHMPRLASRIKLFVSDISIERLDQITDEDAIAEGIVKRDLSGVDRKGLVMWGLPEWTIEDLRASAREAFLHLFFSINAALRQGSNPWVWKTTFRRLSPE